MRRKNLLLVDRAAEFAAMLAAALGGRFAIDVVSSKEQAVAALRGFRHHAFLVDVTGTTDDPGLEFISEVRKLGDRRIVIALSGNLDRELPARCYEAGAHAFVPKTRALTRELRALLPNLLTTSGAVLRAAADRVDGIRLPRASFKFAGASIDPAQMIGRFGSRTVRLNPKEVGILHLLSQRRGTLLRRTDVLAAVWGPDAAPDSKSLDTYMTRLRRAYDDAGIDFRRYVSSAPKVGWRVARP
jgi:two-component system OmpR family response regulator